MEAVEFLIQYESALATQDWGSVSPLIHNDACVTFSNGACHIGKPEIKKAFIRNFDLIQDEEYKISGVKWVVKSDVYAVCVYDFHWCGLIKGEPANGSGRGTMVINREDGAWRLIAEHLGPKR